MLWRNSVLADFDRVLRSQMGGPDAVWRGTRRRSLAADVRWIRWGTEAVRCSFERPEETA